MKHGESELIRFLQAIDGELAAPAQLLIIGGAAAALHYGATRRTSDIDTFHEVPEAVMKAAHAAAVKTSLDIPIAYAAIADAPYDYEDRLEPVPSLGLTNLEVVVPERHDLALMKMIRGYEHDVQVIEQMHRVSPLSFEVLINRFAGEMSHVVSDPRILVMKFLLLLQRLFGNDRRVEAQRTLESDERWRPAALGLPFD